MRWTIHGERFLYRSPWVNLALTDVEIPEGNRFEHHVLRMPFPAVGTVLYQPGRGVLMLYRHRFITDTWGYEIPAGRAEAGESMEQAARREALEETGYEPIELHHLTSYFYANGISDGQFSLFLARGVTEIGPPTDVAEFERLEWLSVDELRRAVQAGEIHDGLSLSALLWVLAFADLDH